MVEIISERKRYGGDKNAINHHSSRIYEHEGSFYEIDRNLDIIPRSYELLERSDLKYGEERIWDRSKNKSKKVKSLHSRATQFNPIFPKTIKVDFDNRFFGEGLNWKQAEKLAEKAIKKLDDETEKEVDNNL